MVISTRCMAVLALLLLFLQTQTNAQTIFGEPNTQYQQSPALQAALKNWEVFQLDASALTTSVKNRQRPELLLGTHHWQLQLVPNQILAPDYTLQILSKEGTQTLQNPETYAFQGFETNENGPVRLTLSDDFVYGYVTEKTEAYYIEPLWYYEPQAPHDLFVVYANSAVIPNSNARCAVVEAKDKKQELLREQNSENQAETISACYQLELAIASDKSMHTKYGNSVTNVQNHNIGVMNNVQGDYSGEFNNDIQFVIVTQVVITGTDPWTTSTNAGILLDDFVDWGNSGGFGIDFDLGQLWTNRDFNQGTVGIAYLEAVCTNVRYHCLQDFTGNAQQLRCMTSHEIGHNFDCNHDPENGNSCPPNFIMCPFVSNSSTWSNTSRNAINSYSNFLFNIGCLSTCGGGAPPVEADFSWTPTTACQNQSIQFTDLSTGNVTGRSWVFQNGTPATSTAQNPSVTWVNAGTFNVTLTVTGTGGPSSITQQVVIDPKPTANFTYSIDGNTVICTNTSTNATSYLWNFGDGGTSVDENPAYEYSVSGTYTVTLTAYNDCGTSTKTLSVKTAPTAAFSASPSSGCVPLTVQFTNSSTGSTITNYNWQFPGGIPTSSTAMNPVVIYPVAGSYDVGLTVTNSTGSNTLWKDGLIVTQTVPSASFSWLIDNLDVTFTNTSSNAISYLWDFGDGSTSTLDSPTHDYASGGIFTVSLTATNDCGSKTFIRSIQLQDPPIPDFSAAVTTGCAPLTVTFNNLSSADADSYLWTFPGGNPATSTAANPTVVYATPGSYSVSLTATNAVGSTSLTRANFVTVLGLPGSGFTGSSSGLLATFENTSSGAMSFSWNFGDGSSASSETSPTHTYATDGSYTVTLSATNSCGSVSSTQIVTIVTAPTAGFSATPTSVCAGQAIQFSNQSSPNATFYEWQFPGGTPSTSTQEDPSVVYSTPGTYSVTLVAGNTAGTNTVTQTNSIVIAAAPTAGFSSSTNGLNASFSNTSLGALSFSWNFGDGGNTSTATSPVHTYAGDGVYTVTLTATNACGSSVFTQIVSIITPPAAGFTTSADNGCATHTVQFSNQSSPNASSYNWLFPGGNPASSSEVNPVVQYATAGTYSVTLIATNAAGSDTILRSNLIVINGVPSAGFSSSSTDFIAFFSNTSVNATSYSWNFGDGSAASTAISPQHVYAADGTYAVTLTATNACGSQVFTQNITILTTPVAGFSASQTSGCGPLTVQFGNQSSSNATSYAWQFPGGNPATSTQAAPMVVYASPGVYSVTLVASNAAGSNTVTQSNSITVLSLPSVNFATTVTGSEAVFSNSSQNSQSFFWNFGEPASASNTSTLANPTHTYAADGVYTVTLTVTNICGAASFSQLVTITTPPTASYTASAGSVCTGVAVQFQNASSENATSFAWLFEGGEPASSTLANPTVIWNQPGLHAVSFTATNASGSETVTGSVTVTGAPEAAFSSQTAGLSVVITNGSGGASSYLWNFGDPASGAANSSTEEAPTHQFGGVGSYDVVLIASNQCGADTLASTVVIAGDAPLPAFEMAGLSSFCAPGTVQFNDLSAGEPNSWLWLFPGATPDSSTLQNPVVVYGEPGIYSVSLTTGNIYGTNTVVEENSILIGQQPVASFETTLDEATIALNNLSLDADTYFWQFGDGDTSTLAAPIHTYTQSGDYDIVLIAANACGSDTISQRVSLLITGAPEVEGGLVFRLFPNPNFGRFTLEMSGEPQEQIEFLLYNSLGQQLVLESFDFRSGLLQHTFDYQHLPAAMYTLQLRAGNQSRFVKIALQR